MNCIGIYDGTIFYNPANKFCIVSVKTADQSVPAEARSNRRYKDHLIRFTAVGYEIPRTDAVELELDGEWTKGKFFYHFCNSIKIRPVCKIKFLQDFSAFTLFFHYCFI